MSIIWLTKNELISSIRKQMKQVDLVLDIGCGINPQNYIKPQVHICCEPFEQYIQNLQEKIKNEHDRHYIIIKASWKDALSLFPFKSVDTVFLVDVIEHLEKKEAFELLKATEHLARCQIILFTPLGFMPQSHPDGKDIWGLDGGSWQEHKSGWIPDDFDDSWNIYAAREYHINNHFNKKNVEPYGAFWAIKNFSKPELNHSKIILQNNRIHKLIAKIFKLFKKIKIYVI